MANQSELNALHDTTHKLGRLEMAIQTYAVRVGLEEISPAQVESDLKAILGEPHFHHASSFQGEDKCTLCLRDLRNEVHYRMPAAE